MTGLLPLFLAVSGGGIAGFILAGLLLKLRHIQSINDVTVQREKLATEKEALVEQLRQLGNRESSLKADLVRLTEQHHLEKDQLLLQLRQLAEARSAQEAELTTLQETLRTAETRWQKQFEVFMLNTMNQTRSQLMADLEKTKSEEEEAFKKEMKTIVQPLTQIVKDYDERTIAIGDRVDQLTQAKNQLVSVLTHNKGRGDWGEVELIRLLEECNLIENIHYRKQSTLGTDNKRPDITVLLPDNRHIFIDAKTLQFDLSETTQFNTAEEEEAFRQKYVLSLRQAIQSLYKRGYQDEVARSADFVILYVPREWMYTVALQREPRLFAEACEKNVLLAGPFNLLGLLRIVLQGWRESEMSDNAQKIIEVAKELHARAALFEKRFHEMGISLSKLNENYTDVRKSFDGNKGFVRQFKKLEEFGARSTKATLLEEIHQPDNPPAITGTVFPAEESQHSDFILPELESV